MRPVLGVTRTEELDPASVPRHQHYIDARLDLSQDEYQQYLDAADALHSHISDSQLFLLVLWNYQEYYDILGDCLTAYAQKDVDYFDNRPVYLSVNGCFLNYLSSVRTYLDYTETRIKRRYGEDSQNWDRFKQYCSDAYDGCFSYRFLYNLRNYAQHCGLPINRINFNTRPKEDNPQEPCYTLSVGTSRDELLRGFDWKRPLREEIAGLPPIIDINPHINAMTDCLARINSDLSRDEFPNLLESARYIRNLLQRISYSSEDGDPCIFELKENDASNIDWTRLGMRRVPIEIADAVINGKIEDISRTITVRTLSV